jgi:Transposase
MREAAIERSDGVLIDALLDAGLTVVVITSRQMKNLRSRYGSAGANDDRFDAFVLADVLRTDRARLRPLAPDMPATITLRAAVRARRDLVAHRIAACNQLRAHLAASFPAGAGLFASLDSQISLVFLARFGSQDAAGTLSEDDLAAWLQFAHHRRAVVRLAPAAVLRDRHLPGLQPGPVRWHFSRTDLQRGHLTWLYNRPGGSILLVAVWHGLYNFVSGAQAATGMLVAVVSTLVMIQGVLLVIWRYGPGGTDGHLCWARVNRRQPRDRPTTAEMRSARPSASPSSC